MGVAYVDGTSPHVQEPMFPGVAGRYLDLSQFCDFPALRRERESVIRLTRAYRDKYSRAYKLIESAKRAEEALSPDISDSDRKRALRRLDGILSRELSPSGKEGAAKRRFLGAVSCEGYIELYGTVSALCDRVYLFDSELGLGLDAAEAAALRAEESGWDVIRLMSWFDPERCEGVLVPELRLGFLSKDRRVGYEGGVCRRLRLDAALPASARAERRRALKLSDAILSEAVTALREAKSLHDRLEAAYNPCVDFDAVRILAMGEAAGLFG